ncbi:MAG: 30S ribosomal protein S9 [Candidatus Omnitrophica bacterium]|nr:30S ribosomal protein S9 [Candidatus Omnitrophota bacterium]
MSPKQTYTATGRRKEAVARVRMIAEGQGRIVINGKTHEQFFCTIDQRRQVEHPFEVLEQKNVDVYAKVNGGGHSGQAGAVGLGIARCLVQMDESLRSALRKEDLLTRDPRAKERKKYGRKGARRRFQWTKR